MRGAQVPYPPAKEDDHLAKLEVYSSSQQLMQAIGEVNEGLQQLMQMQMLLLQQQEEEQTRPGKKTNLKKPSVQSL